MYTAYQKVANEWAMAERLDMADRVYTDAFRSQLPINFAGDSIIFKWKGVFLVQETSVAVLNLKYRAAKIYETRINIGGGDQFRHVYYLVWPF